MIPCRVYSRNKIVVLRLSGFSEGGRNTVPRRVEANDLRHYLRRDTAYSDGLHSTLAFTKTLAGVIGSPDRERRVP